MCAQYGRPRTKVRNILGGASPLLASWRSQLASRKLANREVRSEESGTAKSGTDVQKRHMRLLNVGKQAHLCKALVQQTFSSRCRSDQTKGGAITWGGLRNHAWQSGEVSRGHSNRRPTSQWKDWRTHVPMKD